MLDEKEGSNLAGCTFCLSQTSSPKNFSTVFGPGRTSPMSRLFLLTSGNAVGGVRHPKKTELGYPAAAADSDKTALGNVLDRLLVGRFR